MYNRWTQFDELPSFMDGVEEIRQLDDTHLHWRVKHDGHEVEFDTEIVEQLPDQRIAWKTTDGKAHAGVVTFHELGRVAPEEGSRARAPLLSTRRSAAGRP